MLMNGELEFKRDRVDLEQELISKFNLSNSTPVSKVSVLINYENQKEKLQQVLLYEQLNSWLFSNTPTNVEMKHIINIKMTNFST